jgi:hypothetical protein
MKAKQWAMGAIVVVSLFGAASAQAAVTAVNCHGNPQALAMAVAGASSGTTLSVTGPCNGGFWIGQNMSYGTIQSATSAKVVVNGPIGIVGANSLTLNGLYLKGGGSMNGVPAGLFLAPLSYVTFTNSEIASFASPGVEQSSGTYLEMTDSVVASNKGSAGLLVLQGGTAQLGFFDSNGNLCCGNKITGNAGPGIEASWSANVSSWLTTISGNTGPQIEALANSGIDSRGGSINGGTGTAVLVASGSRATFQPLGTVASGTLTGGTIVSSGIAIDAASKGSVYLRDVTVTASGTGPALLAATQGQLDLQGANHISNSKGPALEATISGIVYQEDGAAEGWAAAGDTVSGAMYALGGASLTFRDGRFEGATLIQGGALGLGDPAGVATVTLAGNVTLSEASGGTGVGLASKTKIVGSLTCNDNTSHFNRTAVTITGTDNCNSYK